MTLKKSVPADWITAAHHAARPSPAACLPGHATQLCSAPPIVNRIEPTKNVIESAESPTRFANPGKGPTKKHVEPSAKNNAIQRWRVMRPHSLVDERLHLGVGTSTRQA